MIYCIHLFIPIRSFIPCSDLEDKRQVPKEAGQALADKWGVPFFECSAFTRKNLEEVWFKAVRLAREIEEEANETNLTRQKSTDQEKEESAIASCLCGSSKWNPDGTMKKATDNIQFFRMSYMELIDYAFSPRVCAISDCSMNALSVHSGQGQAASGYDRTSRFGTKEFPDRQEL